MKTIAAYIRVSTDDQLEYSPDSQRKAIQDYAKRNDMILPENYIFVDEGISGRKAEKRPAFMHMIGLAKNKPRPFDAILVWKFSRFARNREDSIVYKSMLRKQYGIEVISISEQLSEDKTSILIEALLEAMDEYYSINLAEEVKRGMTEKAKRGEALTVPPYGYTIENKQFVPHPEESNIIRQVFEWYNNGEGMLPIARKLNAMGVRTHRGGRIENRTVDYWLHNPVYVGKIRWTPTGATKRDFENPDTMIIDGVHEPLISQELWDSVSAKLAETKATYRKWYTQKEKVSCSLVGVVKCAICGGPMVKCTTHLCCNNHNKGMCIGNGNIRVDEAEQIIINSICNILNMTENTTLNIADKSTQTDKTDIYTPKIQQAQIKLARIKEAYTNGIDTLEEYKENKAKIMNEILILEKELESLNAPKQENKLETLRKNIRENIDTLLDEKTDNTTKNQIIKKLIKHAIKHDNHLDITFWV